MRSAVSMDKLMLIPLRRRGFILHLSCWIPLGSAYTLTGFSNYVIGLKDPCTTQAKLSTFCTFVPALCLRLPPQKQIVLGQNMYNGIMTAQWNGKLRNTKVFDYALTYVRLFRILFMKVKTETTYCAGQDQLGVEVDRLRPFSHCGKVCSWYRG
jgi:hypothetical protein